MKPEELKNVVVLVLLLGSLLFIATNFGLVRCNVVPFWCGAYYSIVGPSKVLIVHGDDGLGDPILLRDSLNKYVKAQAGLRTGYAVPITPVVQHVSQVAEGNLKKYNLVIVTKAKTIGVEKLKAFDKYVREGGRLIWTGDAGTRAEDESEYLYADEIDKNARHEIVGGGWRRVDSDGYEFDFTDLVSVEFVDTYCGIQGCDSSQAVRVGTIQWNLEDDPLAAGLAPNIELDRDLAIVKQVESTLGGTLIVATVNSHSALVKDNKNYGRSVPFIIRTGPGIRVAYYAIPPENFINESKGRGLAFIQNMYYGMVP